MKTRQFGVALLLKCNSFSDLFLTVKLSVLIVFLFLCFQHDHTRSIFVGNLPFGESAGSFMLPWLQQILVCCGSAYQALTHSLMIIYTK